MRWARQELPQVKEFFFDDDTFTDDAPRAAAIARELGKLGVTWSCNAKANVPRELLKTMRDNGLRLLLVGYESGNQQILHNNGGGHLRADMFRLGVDIIRRSNFRRQIAAEITAQFDLFRATSLPLDHVSGHKHFHIHPAVAASVLSIAPRYGMRALRVPQEPAAVLARVEPATASWSATTPWAQILKIRARRAGLLTPDAVFGLRWSGAMTATRLQGLLSHLPRGLIEIYMHPAVA